MQRAKHYHGTDYKRSTRIIFIGAKFVHLVNIIYSRQVTLAKAE